MAKGLAGKSANGASAVNGEVLAGSNKPASGGASMSGPAPAKNSVGGSGSGLFNHPKLAGKGGK